MRKKSRVYIEELVLAQMAGVIPNKESKEEGFNSVAEELDKRLWGLILFLKSEQKQEL